MCRYADEGIGCADFRYANVQTRELVTDELIK
jgi:hypothetical protein